MVSMATVVKRILLVVLVTIAATLCQCDQDPALDASLEVWMTTANTQEKLLSREGNLPPNGSPGDGFSVQVRRDVRDQEVKGYGAALSNSAAFLLYRSHQKEEILRELFSVQDGIGVSYVRLVMGGSDFNAVPPYTYDDMPPGQKDFSLAHFSIDKDREFVLPCLRDILRHNPEVRIMASPWTAPGWMKYNDQLNGGNFIHTDEYFAVYAEYFIRFLRAYRAEGVEIDALTLQNEPHHTVDSYPTMLMSPGQQVRLISQLGPRLRQEGFTTDIIAFDHNWDLEWYPMQVFADPHARQFTSGSAWHCYAGDRNDPRAVREMHPDKDIYFTECSGGEWDASFDSSFGWNLQNLFIGQSRVGARTVLMWNLALDEHHGPRNVAGGCADCRGVLTLPSWGGYTRNQEYYAIGHLAKFVRPGARRVESTTHEVDWLETVAFENPDGSVAMVIWNRSWEHAKQVDINLDGNYYNYHVPVRTCLTLVKRG